MLARFRQIVFASLALPGVNVAEVRSADPPPSPSIVLSDKDASVAFAKWVNDASAPKERDFRRAFGLGALPGSILGRRGTASEKLARLGVPNARFRNRIQMNMGICQVYELGNGRDLVLFGGPPPDGANDPAHCHVVRAAVVAHLSDVALAEELRRFMGVGPPGRPQGKTPE